MQQSEMKVEYWDIDRLIPYVRNPRKNDQAIPKMAGVIKEFGFVYPILVRSDGEVVDGHLRLKTAQYLGMKQVPVEICDDWTPAQVKAFRIAVNKSAEWAEWDDELLQLELDDLKLENFDLELIGLGDGRETFVSEMGKGDAGVEYKEMLCVVIECSSEEEQESLYNEFSERGLKCRVQSL